MSSFFITGVLGSGKGLVSVARCIDYLKQGRKVATNCDLFLSGYFAPESKKTVIRLPDKPTLLDLQNIGFGCDDVKFDENGSPVYDEDKHGLIYLDELGNWFNSRNWQDKERKELLNWFIHARKAGWDTIFNIQDIDMVDGQLRGMLCEHLVICNRLDRVKIPYLGTVLQWFGLKGKFPKIHRARVHYGDTLASLVSETWTYAGKQFYKAYNTKQKFTVDYPHAVHSVLSPWHLKGRFLPHQKTLQERFIIWLNEERPANLKLVPKHPLIERIMKLPVHRRVEFFQRFEQCGAFQR